MPQGIVTVLEEASAYTLGPHFHLVLSGNLAVLSQVSGGDVVEFTEAYTVKKRIQLLVELPRSWPWTKHPTASATADPTGTELNKVAPLPQDGIFFPSRLNFLMWMMLSPGWTARAKYLPSLPIQETAGKKVWDFSTLLDSTPHMSLILTSFIRYLLFPGGHFLAHVSLVVTENTKSGDGYRSSSPQVSGNWRSKHLHPGCTGLSGWQTMNALSHQCWEFGTMSPLSQSSSPLHLLSQRQLRPSVNFNEYTYCGGTMESSLYRQSQEEAWGPCSSSSDLLWAQKRSCAVAEQAVKPKPALLQPLSWALMAATLTLKIFLLHNL